MSIFDVFTRPADLELHRQLKQPEDVWCVEVNGERHATSFLCRGDFVVSLDTARTICHRSIAFTGHQRPGRPNCSACLAALVRAAPTLTRRLAWGPRHVSTCGQYRVRRLRHPGAEDYPFEVVTATRLSGPPWESTDDALCTTLEAAYARAQELETIMLCDLLALPPLTSEQQNVLRTAVRDPRGRFFVGDPSTERVAQRLEELRLTWLGTGPRRRLTRLGWRAASWSSPA